MICPGCGADMGAAERCPYCGVENEAIAKRRHVKEVSGIYAKIAALFRLPVQQTRKIVKGLLLGGVILVCLTSLVIVGSMIYSNIRAKADYHNQADNISKLESLYQAGDYEAMNTVLQGIDSISTSVYEKYSVIGNLHRDLSHTRNHLSSVVSGPYRPGHFNQTLRSLSAILVRCNELEAAGWIYGEEAPVTDFRQQVDALMKDKLKMTQEEIAIAVDRYDPQEFEGTAYSDLSDTIAKRLEGNP